MKLILITLAFLFSYGCYAQNQNLEDGLYHAYWVYGENDNYKTSSLIASKPDKIGNDYYFLNKTNDESNNEIYASVLNGGVVFFYKHDETEGGPSIGWANATLSDNKITIDSLTVKNFHDSTDGDTDKNIKYKI